MSEPGTRPGGLTALAVISFVWALIQLISGVGQVTLPLTMPLAVAQAEKEAAREGAETRRAVQDHLLKVREADQATKEHIGLIMLGGSLDLVFTILLIVAGIGYLKQRRFLGKVLGTVYAVAAIGWGVGALVYVNQAMKESPNIFSLIGFIVPVVTLLMLQMTFKDDFVNP